jgi:transcriptional regulator with XRE-family HTH domain
MRHPPAEILGQTLSLLRRRARLSQRQLADASKISNTQIGDIEKGAGGNPSPITLRALSRGLASDEFEPGGVNQIRADAFYRQLMDAAGYLGGLPVDSPAPDMTEDAAVQFLSSRAGDSDIADRLLRLAKRYPEMAPEDQMVMRHLVDTWIKEE